MSSASNIKTEILFSPFNDNEFLLVGNSLLLYRISNIDGGGLGVGGVNAASGGTNLAGPGSSGAVVGPSVAGTRLAEPLLHPSVPPG